MPTYEYACTSCDEHLEVAQSFRDEALSVCPACGGRLRKVFGSIGVVFKGSGFYKTDSRPAAKASRGTDTGSSASSPEGTAKGAKEATGGQESKAGQESKGTQDKGTQDKGGGGGDSASGSSTPSKAGSTGASTAAAAAS